MRRLYKFFFLLFLISTSSHSFESTFTDCGSKDLSYVENIEVCTAFLKQDNLPLDVIVKLRFNRAVAFHKNSEHYAAIYD